MLRLPWAALAGALVALTSLGACRRPPPPNVVLVVADTLRADRLGAYGSTRKLTPFLDELAARATVFARAYAQSSWTEPSMASLFTSRFESQHGIVQFGNRLDAGELTIAEVLQARGYATGAFVANPGLHEATGFGQGFATYRVYMAELVNGAFVKTRGDQVGDDALRWVDGLPREPARPLLLYLHYMEPHLPYSPPPAMVQQAAGDRPAPDVAAAGAALFFANAAPPDPPTLRDIETVYDAEVLSLDDSLRRTFAGLRTRHVLDDAVVVFTADHGEEFAEHGHMSHGTSLYEEVIRVPLIVALPGQQRHVEVAEPVALVDVAPTLADLAGVARPAPFEGRSLRAALRPVTAGGGGRVPAPPVLSELILPPTAARIRAHERAVIVGEDKLIVGVHGERERYDLARDPGERQPDDADDGALAATLRSMVARFGTPRVATAPALTPEVRDRLKALGYLQ